MMQQQSSTSCAPPAPPAPRDTFPAGTAGNGAVATVTAEHAAAVSGRHGKRLLDIRQTGVANESLQTRNNRQTDPGALGAWRP